MSAIEAASLAILAGAAVLLVALWLVWDYQDRRPLVPPEPEAVREHQPKHQVDNGPTTRLRPPD